MTEKITRISNKGNSSMMSSPEQALQDALDYIGKKGAFKEGKKLLVLCLDESNGEYIISYVQAGMKMSECATLCEIAKSSFLKEMGY